MPHSLEQHAPILPLINIDTLYITLTFGTSGCIAYEDALHMLMGNSTFTTFWDSFVWTMHRAS
jgi:hypothetical protein